jgi:CRP-like cAMP-binding protein
VLVQEGDSDHDLYVITRGEAAVLKGERRVNTLGPGDFFGELAFLTRAPRSATVKAVTDVHLLVLGARELGNLIDREPRLARRMMEAMAKRIAATERSLKH